MNQIKKKYIFLSTEKKIRRKNSRVSFKAIYT